MDTLLEKFAKLGCDNAPGQESRQKAAALELRGEKLEGTPVDFSHGDVDAHPPIPGTLADFVAGVEKIGGHQAYTEYRGGKSTREDLARKISAFTGAAIDPEENIILTPGTQGALFLAIGANMVPGDKVAIVEPDYFANRKLVEFFGGELCPIQMDYYGTQDQGRAGLDLTELEQAFQSGVKLFLFSNPNNPTGVIYSREEIVEVAGIQQGDVITQFDGRAVANQQQLSDTLQYYKAGETVDVTLQRADNGQYAGQTVSVTLGSAKDMPQESGASSTAESSDT